MSLQWFRLYADMPNNPKVRLLAFEDRWHYVSLLCAKAAGILDKQDPLRTKLLRVHLGLAGVDFEHLQLRLLEADLIDEDWNPVGWSDRQYESDISTERVRAYRERMKQKAKRERNVSVTAQETETEAEAEAEKEGQKRARNVRLPADWMPSVQNVEFCQRERPDLNPGEVANRFRDHWLGNGETKRDWDATWRNWVRREKTRVSSAKERTQSWIESLTAPTRSLT